MSTYHQILYHLVFGTRERRPTITYAHRGALHAYMTGVLRNLGCHVYVINGMEDHVHVVCSLPPKLALAEVVRALKLASGTFLREDGRFPNFDGWQEGYGAFTADWRSREKLFAYVQDQETHHRAMGSEEEFERILRLMGLELNVRDQKGSGPTGEA